MELFLNCLTQNVYILLCFVPDAHIIEIVCIASDVGVKSYCESNQPVITHYDITLDFIIFALLFYYFNTLLTYLIPTHNYIFHSGVLIINITVLLYFKHLLIFSKQVELYELYTYVHRTHLIYSFFKWIKNVFFI